jgi:hypothetical protein
MAFPLRVIRSCYRSQSRTDPINSTGFADFSVADTKVTVGLNGSAPAVVGTRHSADGLAIAGGTLQNVVNFGLEPAAGEALRRGQTAGIGFWQNRNGQALFRFCQKPMRHTRARPARPPSTTSGGSSCRWR